MLGRHFVRKYQYRKIAERSIFPRLKYDVNFNPTKRNKKGFEFFLNFHSKKQ
jgi:hypothetical protein